MLHRQNLLVLSVALIIIGAIIWLGPWPALAQPATDVVGQVIFWPGIALLIIWFIIFAYLEIKGGTVGAKP